MKILSDNAAIEKNLHVLKNTILEYGGALDPDLVIRCEGSNLSVEKYGFANPDKPLIALPGELLLPTEKMGLSVKNDEIHIDPPAGGLTDVQRKMADTMIELYNLTGKVPAHKESCCWFLFKDAPDLLERLMTARTLNPMQKKMMAFCKSNATQEETDQLLCETYIKMRTIGHRQASGDQMVVSPDIMPVVDFINHHGSGAFFGFRNGFDAKEPNREFLLINDNRPLAFSNECFAFYNQMDALDSFAMYGFADAYSPYVRSIPIELEIPRTGKIVVNAALSAMHKGVLPKNAAGLRPYIPATLRNEGDTLEITNLLIPTNTMAPHALRRVLRLLMTNRVALKRTLSTNEIWQAVLAAEEKIINENIAFYQDLLTLLDKEIKSADTHRASLVRAVRGVANLQLAKLYKYNFDQSYFSETAEEQEQASMAAAE